MPSIFLPFPFEKGVVSLDGKPYQLLTKGRAVTQAVLPKAHALYDKTYEADGTPIIGYSDDQCPAYAEVCLARICPCTTVCIAVPDAIASLPAGTVLYLDDYSNPTDPADIVSASLPAVATSGTTPIATIAEPQCDGSVSAWDRSTYAPNDLPAGQSYVDVHLFSTESVEVKNA